MTPLLSFEIVSKRAPEGAREVRILDRVSLQIGAGESVGVYGARRAGKSTLLRLAAGLELADEGTVRFGGRDLARMDAAERAALLRGPIAFMSAEDWSAGPGESVVDHVAAALAERSPAPDEARRRAERILAQVEVEARQEPAASLSLSARARVMLARALAREPRLLVLDEPAQMPKLGDRDRFYALLRAVTRERGIALLVASQEMAALQGVDVLMSLADGELCSTEERGSVVPLPKRPAAEPPERTA